MTTTFKVKDFSKRFVQDFLWLKIYVFLSQDVSGEHLLVAQAEA